MDDTTGLSYRQQVGLRVRALRKARRLTQSTLAYSAGIDPRYLRDVEAGRRNVSIDNIGRLANSLGVTLATFFDDDVFRSMGRFRNSILYEQALPADEASVRLMLEMPSDERTVLKIVSEDASLTVDAIARMTGYSRSTVHRILRRLVDARRIERVGSRKSGRWVVLAP